MEIKLKRKYIIGASYKGCKASSNISGSSNKKSNKRQKIKEVHLNGKKLMLLNLSETDQYCAATGKKLPLRGMVVEYNGALYANFESSSRA